MLMTVSYKDSKIEGWRNTEPLNRKDTNAYW